MSLVRILAAAVVAGAPMMAEADSLLGKQITIDWLFPDASSTFVTDTVIAAAGPDVTCEGLSADLLCVLNGYNNGSIVFDIEATSVGMVFTNGSTTPDASAFNGPRFSGLDLGAPITGVSLLSTIPGLDMSRVAFGTDWVSVNLSDVLLDAPSFSIGWRLELLTEPGGGTDVPAPPVLGLLMLGIAGLGMARGRKRDRTAA